MPLDGFKVRSWRKQSSCTKDGDFVFPSIKARGHVPLSASIFVSDHLRPAKKTGVHIEDGQMFGLHNLRHSLSNWLVNMAKVEPKTVQGTLDLYTQDDGDENTDGAGGTSDGAGSGNSDGAVKCGLSCGLGFVGRRSVTPAEWWAWVDLNHRPRPYQSSVVRFYNNLQDRGDCQTTRKSYKTPHIVGWVVGWKKSTDCRAAHLCLH